MCKLSQWLDKLTYYLVFDILPGIFRMIELSYRATKRLPLWCSFVIPPLALGNLIFLVCTLICLLFTIELIAAIYLGILQGLCIALITFVLIVIFHTSREE